MCAILGCAAQVCLLAAVLCESPATVCPYPMSTAGGLLLRTHNKKTQKRQLLRKCLRYAVKILKLFEIKRGFSSSVFQAIRGRKRAAYIFIVLRRIEENNEALVSRHKICDKYSTDSSRK